MSHISVLQRVAVSCNVLHFATIHFCRDMRYPQWLYEERYIYMYFDIYIFWYIYIYIDIHFLCTATRLQQEIPSVTVCGDEAHWRVAAGCIVLQGAAGCCSALQCVAPIAKSHIIWNSVFYTSSSLRHWTFPLIIHSQRKTFFPLMFIWVCYVCVFIPHPLSRTNTTFPGYVMYFIYTYMRIYIYIHIYINIYKYLYLCIHNTTFPGYVM